MSVLIGNGGHAKDIMATLDGFWRLYPHHSEYTHKPGQKVIIAINDPQVRARVAEELHCHDRAWVHPDARLFVGVTYGNGTHINYGAMMTRTAIGSHSTIAPGVHIAGDVLIGDRVFIGIGATIGNLVTIGDDASIGAGSIVLSNVPAGQKVRGVWG